MKKTLFLLSAFFTSLASFSQDGLYKKKPTLSINFMMNDFRSAERLQKGSLETVLRQKAWAKFTEMSPGLSVQYLQGLSEHVDFMATLGGSFADYTFKDQQNMNSTSNFLMEVDANVNVKLLRDKYAVNPFFTAGVGASKYKSSYGAYIPFGLGIQFKLSEESFIFTNAQYRIGITERANNHLNYSIGFGAPLFGTADN